MSAFDWISLLFFIGLIIGMTPLLGKYMARVFQGEKTFVHPVVGWLEKLCYRVSGLDATVEMNWRAYAKALLLFNGIGFAAVWGIQLIQAWLPLNPQELPGVPALLAFNTAASFVTNTNWQAYAGETTLSYATQMAGLTVQNFLSAATGMAVFLVLTRGIARKTTDLLGNFWADLVRGVVYLLLPLSLVFALVLVGQGVIQNFSPYLEVETIENASQVIPMGPAASQVAIKQLGTNGGGFFGANSAHPFENPTGLSNFLQNLAILLIPAAQTSTYGIMIGSKRHGWLIFCVMGLFWLGGFAISLYSESLFNPVLGEYPVLEGIETRFGVFNSILWTASTTSTANGSVNAMLSSLSPLAGGVALFNIMLKELVFGGVGVGFCGMLMFVFLTSFLSGLMVGRTPEYKGKKIERREIQWVMISILAPGALVLIGSGLTIAFPSHLESLGNKGPHGLTEILYTFTSTAGNNGSSFSGIETDTNYFNFVLGLIMLIGRLAIVFPSIALAGMLVRKKITPPSAGTFSTDTFLFSILLTAVILIMGALAFFPALSLGPVVEHFLMLEGQAF